MNIPRNETGNPKATQKASLEFKKSDKKRRTKSIPCKMFSINNFVLSVKVTEESLRVTNFRFSLSSLNLSI